MMWLELLLCKMHIHWTISRNAKDKVYRWSVACTCKKKNSTLTLIRNEFNSKGSNCDRGLLSVSDFCTSPHGTPLGFPCHRRCQPNLYQIEILIAHLWHSLISEMMVKMTLILDQFFVLVRLGWTDTCFLRDSK